MHKLLIAVPTYETIRPETFKSIYDLELGDIPAEFEFVRGYGADMARNMIADKALRGGYSQVMMVDSDIVLPKDAYLQLSDPEVPVCLGFYPRKDTVSGDTVIHISNGSPDYTDANRLRYGDLDGAPKRWDVKGGGLGCCLIQTYIFEKLSYPWFRYVQYESRDSLSEDLYFCEKLAAAGIPIEADTHVRCGHALTGFIYS